MKISGLLLCIVVLLSWSCSSGIVSKKKMINILVDVHLAKEFAQQAQRDKDSTNNYYTEQYLLDAVFKEYNISEEEFENSVVYYANKPDIYLEMYKTVADKLKMHLSKLQLNQSDKNTQEISSEDSKTK
ncbi:MAG: DUF4296 domain-containing protein [Bacteroidales bacterium]